MPSTSRSRGSGRGPDGAPRTQVIAPMSERQQLALVMQISSQDAPPAAPTPAEERKRSRQQRNERGETPLHVAAIRGDHEQVKKLLDQGQEPDVTDFADNNTRATHIGRTRDDSTKKSGNASTNSEGSKRTNMESLAQGEFEGKEATPQEKGSNTENKEECTQLSSGVVSSTQDDTNVTTKKSYDEEESSEDDVSKRKKRKENDDKEPMAKPPPVARSGPGRKPPGPASKTGASPLNKGGASPNVNKGAATSSTGKLQATGKGTPGTKVNVQNTHQNKSGSGKGGVGSQAIKQERRSPVASPKPAQVKEEEPEDQKPPETTAPKVPPLKIVIPGGAGGSGSRNEQEEGGTGQRGGGKGRGNASTLPYVIPCTSADAGQTSDSSDGNCDDKRLGEGGKGGQRVLRSHRTIDGEKDKERTSPQTGSENRSGSGSNQALSSNKSPPPSSVSSNSMFRARRNKNAKRRRSRLHDDGHSKSNAKSFQGQDDHAPSTSSGGTGGRNEADGPGCRGRRYHSPLKSPKSTRQSYGLGGRGRRTPPLKSTKKRGHSSAPGPSVELHPRKRKIKASRESHSREPSKSEHSENSIVTHNVTHSNPYQMYIHKRKQIERRQKALFPVKPKPPKDFNKYLMNRCTYTLQNNVNPEPQVDIPVNLPQQMVKEFMSQERERTRLRIQHQVEKEKLVLAVEQEILRVHGRAERAVANQALPFSVCTILRDKEVYNVLAPDQEEKRNAQRSRCNGRQINSWLQEVDDKWEKIKEGMLRRQHTEAETLHAVQMMGWEWKLKELGLCDHKNTPKIDPAHVPQIHVSNFDLPA
ncbi:ankyrin repeat domain-containing protein 11 isoform X9 [Zerene cesonia]|uniref:ankyrin repeat domain-containing protein 11 isoform X9 n=1 Tax=Zerene cesonia TaxID=33412 RepID=UPI0018E4FAEA|nr:ankyrin repeat domain-containing protein 11 isoform X9 [Zerene cesonia]